jgi:hypothetical protein
MWVTNRASQSNASKVFFEAAVLGGIDNLGEPIDGLVHGDIDHALL